MRVLSLTTEVCVHLQVKPVFEDVSHSVTFDEFAPWMGGNKALHLDNMQVYIQFLLVLRHHARVAPKKVHSYTP